MLFITVSGRLFKHQTSTRRCKRASIMRDYSQFSRRDRILAHITRALLAGLLVQVCNDILALREPGEVIDDGEHVVPITQGGLYRRNVDNARSVDNMQVQCPCDSWVAVYADGCSPRPFLRRILDALSDQAIVQIESRLNTSSVHFNGEVSTAIRTTMRLAKPPTTVVLSRQNHLRSLEPFTQPVKPEES
jgi:hypothetical protein